MELPWWILTRDRRVTGWWLSHPSEKNILVSWDYEIPIIYGKINNVPNHQPGDVEQLDLLMFTINQSETDANFSNERFFVLP